jgi:hypothetical protein
MAVASNEPARAQGCLTAEVCRAMRLQQQAAQEQAAAYAQQQAAMAAQRQRRAADERRHAVERQQEANARAMAEAAQQEQASYERQQAAARQAKLNAEQQAAEQQDADARKKLVEETRVANLLAAEQSPNNYCKEQSVAGDVINHYNSLVAAGNRALSAVDIEHLITEQFDKQARTSSCHGTFVMTNGSRRSGSVVARPNVAGTIIVSFHETKD